MKHKLLFLLVVVLAAAHVNAQAAPVITANIETLDYGQIEIGYPVTKTFIVTGYELNGDINLAVTGKKSYCYQVSPTTITPQSAANGAVVTVKCSPVSNYISPASITLTSADAQDVIIPIAVDPVYPEHMFINNQVEEFTALVGQMVTRTGGIRFADAEIPPDPNQPVVRSNNGNDMLLAVGGSVLSGDYSLVLEGADKSQFKARIVKTSSITKMCNVSITYAPRSMGSHQATLKVYCSRAGVPLVTVKLQGESSGMLGDLDGNGILDVTDLTHVINLLLHNGGQSSQGDFDDNGALDIDDVTQFISFLLNN